MGSLRRADVLWRATIDGVLVRPLGATTLTKLAGTGGALWALLDEPSSFDDLCARLATAHDVDVAVVTTDLVPVVEDLIAKGVLERIDG
ncbi:MAG: PqqD family protein [Acidimicrobiales bacterium]